METSSASSDRQSQVDEWVVVVLPLLVFLITATVFSSTLNNGFVNWDDDWNLLENPNYRGLGWPQLRWMFGATYTGHYQPLTWLSFGLDYVLWGMNPFGYHLTSLLLHAANAVLFYFVSSQLISRAAKVSTSSIGIPTSACIAALLFALHPLRVESVAWVTERRDVLSGFFLLLTVFAYLRSNSGNQPSRPRWLMAAIVFFAISLLAKATGMGLPIVLLVLDVYPLRRLGYGKGCFGRDVRSVWLEKLPFLLPALAAAVVALYAQEDARALRSLEKHGFLARLMQASFGVVFYLWKTILPLNLSPLYAIPVDFNPFATMFLSCAAIVLAATVLLFCLRKRWPAGIASWLCYGVILAPVSGIAQSGPQLAADRYTYIACLAWAVLAGGAIFRACWTKSWGAASRVAFAAVHALGISVVVGLGWLTWQQVPVWKNSATLWKHALATGYESGLAHNNLGIALFEQSNAAAAMRHFRRAIEINDAYADAHFNLAKVLESEGAEREALQHFTRSVELKPANAVFQAKLGLSFAKQKNLDSAKEHFQRAIELNPADAKARANLGNVLAERGENEAAILAYGKALEIDPGLHGVHMNLGLSLLNERRLDEAALSFDAFLKVTPDFFPAHYYLGVIAAIQGKFDNAAERFNRTIMLNPQFAEGYAALARVMARQGKMDDALKYEERAISLFKSQGKDPPRPR